MQPILHIVNASQWLAAQSVNAYRGDTLDSDGFIHCSLPGQVLAVANDRFPGQSDLLLLVIDPAKVPAEIRHEDCYESGQEFPHIYGPLPVTAIIQTLSFPPKADGTFRFPEEGRWLLENQPPE